MARRDSIFRTQSSQTLCPHDRAREPKTLKLLPGVGHGLAHGEVFELVSDWLLQKT